MTKVRQLSVRRSQLIRPFGVGALVVGPDGASMITAGLDYWYEREDGDDRNLDPEEFRVDEWRLQGALGVGHFRQPPDLRWRGGPNTRLHVPMLRFPQWHQCPRCRRLTHWPLTDPEMHSCTSCESQDRKRPRLLQVRFVAMCAGGHIFDFPWREWAHDTASPSCGEDMRMSGMSARCSCGKARPLQNVTQHQFLPIDGYHCPGSRPWLGDAAPEQCDQKVRAAFRTSSNVYFPVTRSSIHIPPDTHKVRDDLIGLLNERRFSMLFEPLRKMGMLTPADLREVHPGPLRDFRDEEIEAAIAEISEGRDRAPVAVATAEEHPETSFRRAEFEVLNKPLTRDDLMIRVVDTGEYAEPVRGRIAAIALVERLRVTEALTGFTRVHPDDSLGNQERMRLLRRAPVRPRSADDWLPAHVVHGEGVFIDLGGPPLREWERTSAVRKRVEVLRRHYEKAITTRSAGGGVARERFVISPRSVLLHTFAHLVINRLTYESGYSAAALAERLYVSDDVGAPMAALLIYTAAGDSDGTLGGLVRLGRPGHLERIVEDALRGAAWCSADPVCAEMASAVGQGPDSCNLAACHSCALLPEPACEFSNRFLDRALVVRGVGGTESEGIGFFNEPDMIAGA